MEVDRDDLKSVLRAVQENEGMCGRSMIAKVLRGSQDKRLISLGLDRSPVYGALADKTLEQIGYLVDEALSLGLVRMRDAGWNRGRHRQEAHFPVLTLTDRGTRTLKEVIPLKASVENPVEGDSSERARLLAMRAMVQGAFALQDWKHERIEAADFVRESPGDHLVLFAMERHPGGRRMLCLYLWQQRSNRVDETEMVPAWRVSSIKTWFERKLEEYRQKPSQ